MIKTASQKDLDRIGRKILDPLIKEQSEMVRSLRAENEELKNEVTEVRQLLDTIRKEFRGLQHESRSTSQRMLAWVREQENRKNG